ncbi:hypothetical protein MGYG_06913 [Nannizzia gypsea CBS 118893]|uniref:Uncharacterized protein n=1 Tax=Arthroderma gypseum (strain ATCC MYA-4604 / CBS 118893) TaxID=535722 RepID=E4V1J9_ARTGP|nr:hypothetical protein MGYG_06913 [Nannizzia gypsea CBS 118893]EFR03914.1 hypothetical protein MGYG_06913 [Nannizzia gypsea CBS 118893]
MGVGDRPLFIYPSIARSLLGNCEGAKTRRDTAGQVRLAVTSRSPGVALAATVDHGTATQGMVGQGSSRILSGHRIRPTYFRLLLIYCNGEAAWRSGISRTMTYSCIRSIYYWVPCDFGNGREDYPLPPLHALGKGLARHSSDPAICAPIGSKINHVSVRPAASHHLVALDQWHASKNLRPLGAF